ncbi:MAG: FIG00465890: hypothetical protein [uncultured Paraburkholderia sp.]|nr:MAG: FIG00465890: hypothetical protein [uncultured Paraburkholderia sp.]CAH2930170.1 MAG: FIG00465890: hypothetical protein [uncultured Paraburkholderia sp.]
MQASVTSLHLLKHTPFFTSLTADQLRWASAHSQKWKAQADALITQRESAPVHGTQPEHTLWILLDGNWRIEWTHAHALLVSESNHAGTGKWFSATVTDKPFRLVAAEHSYVMRIEHVDFENILKQGFACDSHLDAGRRYYATIFATGPHCKSAGL